MARASFLRDRGVLVLVAGLVLFALSQYADAFHRPLSTDDYLFLDKTRGAPFASVWEPRNLVPAYYRPWSRELHYWTLQRLFGASGLAFRLVDLLLWLATMVAFLAFARRVAGTRVALAATLAVATLSGWGLLLVWAAGAQDLWMLLFALLFLNAFAARRFVASAIFLTLALLSKETAAVLPLVAFAEAVLVERRAAREGLARVAPPLLIVAAWAACHPLLGGRFWLRSEGVPPFASGAPPLSSFAAAAAAVVNAWILPRPEGSFGAALARGAAGALVLVATAIAALGGTSSIESGPPGGDRAPRGKAPAPAAPRVRAFGAAWAVIAWLPMLAPGVGWQTYYGLLGAMGAWLAIAHWLTRPARAEAPSGRAAAAASKRTAWSVVLLAAIAGLAVLRALAAGTPTNDWGSEWFARRSARLTGALHDDLVRRHPSFPRGARIFVADLPGGIGLVTSPGRSPALRTWYPDSDPWVGYFSHYARRAPRDDGPDFFLVATERGEWRELAIGPEDVARARREDPDWAGHHQQLAELFYRAADVRRAYEENRKLADALPGRAEFALNAGVCARDLGDSAAFAYWIGRARSGAALSR